MFRLALRAVQLSSEEKIAAKALPARPQKFAAPPRIPRLLIYVLSHIWCSG
jgi:hypothetical protein